MHARINRLTHAYLELDQLADELDVLDLGFQVRRGLLALPVAELRLFVCVFCVVLLYLGGEVGAWLFLSYTHTHTPI